MTTKLKSHLSLAATAITTALLSVGTAHAQGGEGGGFASLIPLILIMFIFYFLLIRPQQKRTKAHKAMIGALTKGDSVVTGGGLIGTITGVKEDTVKVEIATGVKVTVQRETIVSLTRKETKSDDAPEKSEKPKKKSAKKSAKKTDKTETDEADNKK